MHPVLQTFDRARRVLPRALGDRRRLVGLLHAPLDLVEDAAPEGRERGERGVGVGVLGFEIRNHFRIVAVAEPVPVVVAHVAVLGELVRHTTGRGRGGAGGGRFGSGHRRGSLNATDRRIRSRYDFDLMPPVTTPIPFTVEEIDAVVFNADGLVPAIVQEEGTNLVLMVAWMNRDALERTLETGRTWFWSRSRQEYWCKGETSGDRQYVRAGYYDCDLDVALVRRRAGGKRRVSHG